MPCIKKNLVHGGRPTLPPKSYNVIKIIVCKIIPLYNKLLDSKMWGTPGYFQNNLSNTSALLG